jgi:hypothetical protein
MVMNPRQEIALLKTRNARLEAEVKKLTQLVETKLSTPAPQPRVPEIPKWAGSGGDPITGIGTGVTYTGPPSVVPTGDGVNWVKERRANGDWKDPFGQWRYQSGELIPRTIEPSPVGPQRDPQHDQNVALLDRIVPTFKE